jgi:hypothetical protein
MVELCKNLEQRISFCARDGDEICEAHNAAEHRSVLKKLPANVEMREHLFNRNKEK